MLTMEGHMCKIPFSLYTVVCGTERRKFAYLFLILACEDT